MYREKAWCGQENMKEWISTEWANPFKNPIGQNSDGKIVRNKSIAWKSF